MGHSYSQPTVPTVSTHDSSLLPSTKEETNTSIHSKQDYVYLLVHNHTVRYYIEDETLIDVHVKSYMREIFKDYISRWDAYSFFVVQREPFQTEVEGCTIIRSVCLMSRAIHFLGRYEQIEEEIEVIRVPRYRPESEENQSDHEEDSEEDNELIDSTDPIPDKEE
jgi:hypothetical protein